MRAPAQPKISPTLGVPRFVRCSKETQLFTERKPSVAQSWLSYVLVDRRGISDMHSSDLLSTGLHRVVHGTGCSSFAQRIDNRRGCNPSYMGDDYRQACTRDAMTLSQPVRRSLRR